MKATVALLGSLLAACGSKTPAPAGAVVVGNVAPDAGAGAAPPLPAGCPATWRDATSTGACDAAASTDACAYPEGSCWCGPAPRCSGAAIDPAWYASQPTSWQCTPVPPAWRADGCPGTEPSGACGQEGQSCTYGDCCVTTIVCRGGQWQYGMASCPP